MFEKISMFGQHFDFLPKFQLLTKISNLIRHTILNSRSDAVNTIGQYNKLKSANDPGNKYRENLSTDIPDTPVVTDSRLSVLSAIFAFNFPHLTCF